MLESSRVSRIVWKWSDSWLDSMCSTEEVSSSPLTAAVEEHEVVSVTDTLASSTGESYSRIDEFKCVIIRSFISNLPLVSAQ